MESLDRSSIQGVVNRIMIQRGIHCGPKMLARARARLSMSASNHGKGAKRIYPEFLCRWEDEGGSVAPLKNNS